MKDRPLINALKLLLDLAELEHNGKNDSEEADAIREQLDLFIRHLDEKQIALIENVSEALNYE